MIAPRSVLIDTGLLVLLVVGTTKKSLISRHKRTRSYAEEDYDLLCTVLDCFQTIFVTPNILTEASNLLSQIGEPDRSAVMSTFARLIPLTAESYTPSAQASVRREFVRLGLTDSCTLEGAAAAGCTVTADLDLYLALQAEGRTAYNFNHLRMRGWQEF